MGGLASVETIGVLARADFLAAADKDVPVLSHQVPVGVGIALADAGHCGERLGQRLLRDAALPGVPVAMSRAVQDQQ